MSVQFKTQLLSSLSAAALMLTTAACGMDEPTDDEAGPNVGVESSEVQGTAFSITVGGRTRTYAVSQPATCTASCPVIVDIHGFTSTNTGEQNASGIFQLGNQQGIITVWPQGLNNSWNAGSGQFGSCCGQSQSNNVDDVAFMRAMVAKIKVDFPRADPKRFYATGISNGCALSQRLAAEASDVFAAATCSSLYLLTGETSLARPISMTEIHGRQDRTVSYNQSSSWTGAQNNFHRWATLNGCTGAAVRTNLTANSFVERFSSCAAGTQVALYSIRSGHITYQNNDGLNIAQITWDNLKSFRLP
jgi:polyhydroxybutyrate depolymerase